MNLHRLNFILTLLDLTMESQRGAGRDGRKLVIAEARAHQVARARARLAGGRGRGMWALVTCRLVWGVGGEGGEAGVEAGITGALAPALRPWSATATGRIAGRPLQPCRVWLTARDEAMLAITCPLACVHATSDEAVVRVQCQRSSYWEGLWNYLTVEVKLASRPFTEWAYGDMRLFLKSLPAMAALIATANKPMVGKVMLMELERIHL